MIGWIGALLLLAAWIPETVTTMKTKNLDAINIKFIIMSLMGSIVLSYYSYSINDLAFLFLNGTLAVVIFIELLVYIYKSKN